MSQRLIIILPAYEDGPGLWGRVDGGRVVSHGRSAPPANDGAGEIIAVLPGQSVRIYAHELPDTSKRDRLRAAGFSIEDKIAVPLESMHVALDDDRIGVMEKADLKAALAQLSEAGFSPVKAYADYDVLAEMSGVVSVLGRLITAGPLGYTVDAEWEDGKRPTPMSDEETLTAIAARIENGGALNMLQNGFGARSSFNLDWRKFSGIGGVAACLGVAALILQMTEARALKLQAADLKIQTAKIYSDATGQVAPPNPAVSAAKLLKSGGKDNLAFLRLSKILFDGVASIDGLSVDQLRYQDSRNELQLRIIYPSFESAGELEKAVRAAGGQLTTGGVREQSGEFVGEATLRGGA